MRRRGASSLITAAILVLSGTLHAATPVEPLPDGVAGHISFKSPLELLASFDDFAANSTAGAANALPPGLLTMLATVYSPIPMDSWKADREAHLIILNGTRPNETSFVLVVRVDDFNQFVDSLEERDWLMGEPEEGHGFANLRPVVLPGGRSAVLADLGEGRVAAGESASRIRQALANGDWVPSHNSTADICAVLPLNDGDESLIEKTAAYVHRQKRAIVDAIAGNGIQPHVAEGIASVLEKYAPQLVAELEKAESMRGDLWIDGDGLTLDFGVRSAEGAVLREIADHAAAAPAPDPALAGRFSGGAASVVLGAAIEDLADDVRQRYLALIGDIYGIVWPSLKTEMTAIADRYFQSAPGQTAMASFLNGERQSNVSLVKTTHPEEMLKQLNDGMRALNELWSASIDNPALEAELTGELKNSGEQAYHSYRPRFKNDDGQAFQAFLDDLAARYPELRTLPKIDPDFRIFLSRLDDAVVVAAGSMRDEEFAAVLDELRRPAEKPLFGRPAAAALLPRLTPGQIGVVLMDADELFRLVATGIVQEREARLEEGRDNPVRAALNAMRPQNRGDVLGFSLGGEDGWLMLRTIVPVDAVNTIVRDYESLGRARAQQEVNRQLMRRPPPDAGEGYGEEEEDDEAEDMEQIDAA